MFRPATFILAIMMTLALPTVQVSAQARGDADARSRSRVLFRQGVAHFQRGEYDLAASAFEAGYRLEPKALFLYNAAQAYRKGRHAQRSLELYEAYLEAAPDAPERAEVERHLDALRSELGTSSGAAEKPRDAKAAPSSPPAPGETNEAAPPRPAQAVPSTPLATTPPPAGAVLERQPASAQPEPHSRRWLYIGGSAVIVAGAVAAALFLVPRSPPTGDLGSYSITFNH